MTIYAMQVEVTFLGNDENPGLSLKLLDSSDNLKNVKTAMQLNQGDTWDIAFVNAKQPQSH
ncbi:MAG: hypothetical protein AAGC55_16950, partial [Myxococcota bacterium]